MSTNATPDQEHARKQALLDLLKNKQVLGWTITPHTYDANYATFVAQLENGSQARGYLAFSPLHNKWYAGGAVIPAHQARCIEETAR